MKSTIRIMVVGALALLVSIPAALAQTPEVSILPVTEPLDVGGTILQPGTYAIRVLRSTADRNKVQITSTDYRTVYATVLTVPRELKPGEEIPNTKFVFYPAGEGQPAALRTWFAADPPTRIGHDIVYDESRARQLARLARSPVVFYTSTTADRETLRIVTPAETVETYTYIAPPPALVIPPPPPVVIETPPMLSATEARLEMPATASNTPLFALLGLLAIAGAVALRVGRP